MNSRKLYLSLMSGCLVGLGAFFLFNEVTLAAKALAVVVALAAAFVLYGFAAYLSGRSARAFVGLALVVGAVGYGAQDGGAMLPYAVLWAGVLFGALDSLGKMFPMRSAPAISAE